MDQIPIAQNDNQANQAPVSQQNASAPTSLASALLGQTGASSPSPSSKKKFFIFGGLAVVVVAALVVYLTTPTLFKGNIPGGGGGNQLELPGLTVQAQIEQTVKKITQEKDLAVAASNEAKNEEVRVNGIPDLPTEAGDLINKIAPLINEIDGFVKTAQDEYAKVKAAIAMQPKLPLDQHQGLLDKIKINLNIAHVARIDAEARLQQIKNIAAEIDQLAQKNIKPDPLTQTLQQEAGKIAADASAAFNQANTAVMDANSELSKLQDEINKFMFGGGDFPVTARLLKEKAEAELLAAGQEQTPMGTAMDKINANLAEIMNDWKVLGPGQIQVKIDEMKIQKKIVDAQSDLLLGATSSPKRGDTKRARSYIDQVRKELAALQGGVQANGKLDALLKEAQETQKKAEAALANGKELRQKLELALNSGEEITTETPNKYPIKGEATKAFDLLADINFTLYSAEQVKDKTDPKEWTAQQEVIIDKIKDAQVKTKAAHEELAKLVTDTEKFLKDFAANREGNAATKAVFKTFCENNTGKKGIWSDASPGTCVYNSKTYLNLADLQKAVKNAEDAGENARKAAEDAAVAEFASVCKKNGGSFNEGAQTCTFKGIVFKKDQLQDFLKKVEEVRIADEKERLAKEAAEAKEQEEEEEQAPPAIRCPDPTFTYDGVRNVCIPPIQLVTKEIPPKKPITTYVPLVTEEEETPYTPPVNNKNTIGGSSQINTVGGTSSGVVQGGIIRGKTGPGLVVYPLALALANGAYYIVRKRKR